MNVCIDCGSDALFRSFRCKECFTEVVESVLWLIPPANGPAKPEALPARRGRPPGTVAAVTGTTRCMACNREVPTYAAGRPRKWCSAACAAWARTHPGQTRPSDWVPYKRLPQKVCPQCDQPFQPRQRNVKFCSRNCASTAQSRLWAAAPRRTQCSEPGCTNPPRMRGRSGRPDSLCSPCKHRKYPENPETAKARYRRKTHVRKSRTKRIDLPIADERRLRAEAKRCPLCRRRLIEEPYRPASKELDHIVPLNQGGTHTIYNVRVICRACNQARPKDGSDYTGPVSLFAVEVA